MRGSPEIIEEIEEEIRNTQYNNRNGIFSSKLIPPSSKPWPLASTPDNADHHKFPVHRI
jgi:hypothetical protein